MRREKAPTVDEPVFLQIKKAIDLNHATAEEIGKVFGYDKTVVSRVRKSKDFEDYKRLLRDEGQKYGRYKGSVSDEESIKTEEDDELVQIGETLKNIHQALLALVDAWNGGRTL